ncbi:MAG: hypothetical protein VW338_00010 [Rhodospirillaceae bacterium]
MAFKKCVVGSDNIVANVVTLPDEWEADNPAFWQPPAGFRLVDQGERGQIGATARQDGGFDDPPPPPAPGQTAEERIGALEATIQVLVDKAVVAKVDLPADIQDRIQDKKP